MLLRETVWRCQLRQQCAIDVSPSFANHELIIG
jgi:hypothetical protein